MTRYALFAIPALLIAAIVLAQSQTSGSSSSSTKASGSASGSGWGSGNASTAPWRDPNKEVFALIYSPGPMWVRNKSIYEQDLMDHGQYMSDLLKANILLLGGPFKDSSGGMAVIQVNNGDEAMMIAANDPAVKKRVLNVVARPWHIVFERGTGVVQTGGGGTSTGPVRSGGSTVGGG